MPLSNFATQTQFLVFVKIWSLCWLNLDALTDVLNFSAIFEDWTSINKCDAPFGGKLWTTPALHSGSNSFFFQPPCSKVSINGLLNVLSECLESKAPTRFIVVIPKQEKLPSKFMEIASLHPPCPLIQSNDSFISLSSTMTIILGLNKISMLTDPINWEIFKSRVHHLCESWGQGLLSVSESTNNLFSERSSLSLALSLDSQIMSVCKSP